MSFYNAGNNSANPAASQKQRIEYFRRYHQVGERVRGKVLNYQGPASAWVQVEGHTLLASLQTAPQPEEIIFLQITQLHPQIVLQELHGQANLSVKELINQFWSDRYKFDSILTSWQGPQSSLEVNLDKEQLRLSFLRKLAEHKEGFKLFSDMIQTLRLLNLALGAKTRTIYWPWLPMTAINHEGFIRPANSNKDNNQSQKMWEACYAFQLPRQNDCFIQLYMRDKLVRYRLYLTNFKDQAALEKWLQSQFKKSNLEVQGLGIAPMPETLSGPLQILLKEELASGSTSIHVQI